ncbi:MAG: hypothetical protein A2622_10265 [Bdellovibrionales bacterium RIFCSPHIGHO2_01_FULL_40_29]|nr:MAG: hypothetical protein A2622_10265 [Bdellovibrionales bacterium RIFCSPHIGHO2_01_FULL_40_29]OFZ32372.1 MAG: hypothetical protein A3D17_12395 [Bdellovibrionales bacterium RIFCSPHIGHO2_02_FULL_40_15]
MKYLSFILVPALFLGISCSSHYNKTLKGNGLSTIENRMDKQARELDKIADTKRTEKGLITTLNGDTLFDTGKTELKSEAKDNLQKIADIMKKYPENILTIRGYTDATGPDSINDILSERRASAVKEILIQNNFPSTTIKTIGYGEDYPIADNTTKKGRLQNRRIEIEIAMDASRITDSLPK